MSSPALRRRGACAALRPWLLAAILLSPLLAAPPAAAQGSGTLLVRASGTVAAGAWPRMELRVDGQLLGSVDVASPTPLDYTFRAPTLSTGSRIDVVFVNEYRAGGQERRLAVHYLSDGRRSVLPTLPGAQFDRGAGAQAFDGLDVLAPTNLLASAGALRLAWPAVQTLDPATMAARADAARFLLQAGFGPSPADLDRLAGKSYAAWIDAQMALPFQPDFVNWVQSRFALGPEYRPFGGKYSDAWVGERFFATAATAEDQLRKRVAFALHHVFMASQADGNLTNHGRAYARYFDTLNRHAFGSHRALLEDLALSPVMGIYLSHIRNRKEDGAGRMPDENFARELMQLFTIGLVELKPDGTPQLDAAGQAVETYTPADVLAMSKVFTGWSWGFPDDKLTEAVFRTGTVDYSVAGDTQVDLQNMRAYPGQGSTAALTLFAGKPHAVSIPANTPPETKLRLALDALVNHPNAGPFLSRQLIQQLVASNPSPAYVARIAAVYADNGRGVRGDLGAVVRALLLDPEARQGGGSGKLREPMLRVAQWIRAFGATSVSGQYQLARELESEGQRVLRAPSVFGWFRPGFVPPGTVMAAQGATAPEFQIVTESSTAAWVNKVEAMVGPGIGGSVAPSAATSTTAAPDVKASLAAQAALVAAGDVERLVQDLNVLLFAGRMSAALRQDMLDAMAGVAGGDANGHLNRARVAVFVAMSSPEFLSQR